MSKQNPVVLCILDGWGYNESKIGNSIEIANTPNWHRMLNEYPHNLIDASGEAVGLPDGQMGNSEVGHTNIGAGRVVMQLLGMIEQSIKNDNLKDNEFLKDFIQKVKSSNGACHLIGLLSDGGVHAHIKHIIALAKAVENAGVKVYLHAITDGRDTPPSSAIQYMEEFLEATKDLTNLEIATISGRYYTMDRNKIWDRTKLAYEALTEGKTIDKFINPMEAIKQSYANGVTDEFIVPTAKEGYDGMNNGDGVLIANFRADRVRQIADALANPNFDNFERDKVVKFSALLG
ncbi:MAG: 2,3-bisphosphoglycerate-independent phosphoglycerate mutase, partial [Alphaproteobacteria bacterium]|nr:2,3-bisphosphoglycerate-independent phosphoglycerate mutase [Alphaproteobacteria bacterium]